MKTEKTGGKMGKSIEEILTREDKFIMNIFATLQIPDSHQQDSENEDEMDANESNKEHINGLKTQRAKSLEELQKRLENITKTKRKLSYKDKLIKKGLKNRIKKKSKMGEKKNAENKLKRAAQIIKTENGNEDGDNNDENADSHKKKAVFNKENGLVYSKIDFANMGKQKAKKQKKDPKQLLKGLQSEKERLKKLEEEGELAKANKIKEKTAWKNALAKAEGEKVKDDPILLKKTVQRKEQKVRASKKKWKARKEGVEKAQADKQKKRQENLDKRKKDKKVTKLKKAVKRGKVIPGF